MQLYVTWLNDKQHLIVYTNSVLIPTMLAAMALGMLTVCVTDVIELNQGLHHDMHNNVYVPA